MTTIHDMCIKRLRKLAREKEQVERRRARMEQAIRQAFLDSVLPGVCLGQITVTAHAINNTSCVISVDFPGDACVISTDAFFIEADEIHPPFDKTTWEGGKCDSWASFGNFFDAVIYALDIELEGDQ